MNLGSAQAADAEAMAEVHAGGFETPWSAADLAALLGSAGVFAVAAWDETAMRGFILARAIAGEAEILTLAVEPDHRRQGLARALVTAAIGAASTAGAAAMFLEVAEDNAPAISLYEALGFVRAGRRRGYYARADSAVDALVMRREIGAHHHSSS